MSEYKKQRKPRPEGKERRERPDQERRENRQEQEAIADGLIEGRNAVTEALRAGTAIDKVYIAKGETDAALGHIAAKAKAAGAVV